MRVLFVPLALGLVLAVAACGGSSHRQSQQIRRGGASGAIREIQVARHSRRFLAIFPRHPASARCSIGGATRRISALCSTRVHYVPDGKSSVYFTAHVHVRNAPVIRVRVTVAGGKVLSVAQPRKLPGEGPSFAAYSATPRHGYSVATVKAAFKAQGVNLHPFQVVGDKPSGATWVTLIGKWPHAIHVNVRLGPLTGIYKRVTNQMSAVGVDAKQYRNVLVAWRPRDQAVVRGALHRLK